MEGGGGGGGQGKFRLITWHSGPGPLSLTYRRLCYFDSGRKPVNGMGCFQVGCESV